MKSCKLHILNVDISYEIFDKNDISAMSGKLTRGVIELAREKNINISKIAVITYFRIAKPDDRNKGDGSRAMKWLISTIKDKEHADIILILSMPLVGDYHRKPVGTDLNIMLSDQALFFEYNGFRNISALYHFEPLIPYIYMDSDSRPIIREIIRLENDVI